MHVINISSKSYQLQKRSVKRTHPVRLHTLANAVMHFPCGDIKYITTLKPVPRGIY